jgi:hypothetical protein
MNSILLLSIVCLISLSSTLFDSADARIFLTGEDGGDCKSVGTWNSMSNTCTLTKDVTDFIFIGSLHGGFTLDGNYHTLKIEECLVTEDAISRMYWYGTALTIYTKDVTVKNLTIKGTENPNCTNDAEWDKSHGIISGLNTILYDNVIEGHDIGIMITDNDAQLIRDNIIRFNEKGISFRDGTFDTEIVDNIVYSNDADIVIHNKNYNYADIVTMSSKEIISHDKEESSDVNMFHVAVLIIFAILFMILLPFILGFMGLVLGGVITVIIIISWWYLYGSVMLS